MVEDKQTGARYIRGAFLGKVREGREGQRMRDREGGRGGGLCLPAAGGGRERQRAEAQREEELQAPWAKFQIQPILRLGLVWRRPCPPLLPRLAALASHSAVLLVRPGRALLPWQPRAPLPQSPSPPSLPLATTMLTTRRLCLFPLSPHQGGFAQCYKLTDVQNRMTYAGKIVAKASLKQHRAKEKVRRLAVC